MASSVKTMENSASSQPAYVSTVYGPVVSWRYGKSLGIDLIRDVSTCSFNCIYCQLGDIRNKTKERGYFVSTNQILSDLENSRWQEADIITFSGSGEPTLALNCAEVIHAVKALTKKPVKVLTNGTLLHIPEAREALMEADEVSVKLDAPNEETLKLINRPVEGITLETIIEGIMAFKAEYKGKLSLQTMFMPVNVGLVEDLAGLIRKINPDEVQLNTPKRPYPLEWVVDSRGNHSDQRDYPTRTLTTITPEAAMVVEEILAQKTGVPVISIYHHPVA